MSPTILALVLAAAALHAGWNLISKRVAAGGSAVAFVLAYRALSLVLYAPWVAWVLWQGDMAWSPKVLLFIGLASLLHLGYNLSLQLGYQKTDLSVLYPVARGTGPLLSSLVAILFLGEAGDPVRLAGIALVVAGILLIASDGRLRRFTTPHARGALWRGLLTGLFIAAYTLVDAWSVKMLLIVPVVLDWCAALGNVALLAPRFVARPQALQQAMRGRWWPAFWVAALSPLAYILVLYAYRLGGDISLVAPLREISLMMGTVAGVFILREPASWGRWLGCAIIIGGGALLA